MTGMRARRSVLLCVMLVSLVGCREGSDPSVAPTVPVPVTRDAPPREFFHTSTPYRLQNSIRGLHRAKQLGYRWIDIDSNYCRASTGSALIPLAVHWPRLRGDHFADPAGRFAADDFYADLRLHQVRRLRTDDPHPYRVQTMIEMVRTAGRLGVRGIEWEVKAGAGFEEPGMYRPVLAAAERAGVEIVVKTLRNVGGEHAALRRLEAAHQAGATTMLLNHGRTAVRIDAERSTYVDFVRGKWDYSY